MAVANNNGLPNLSMPRMQVISSVREHGQYASDASSAESSRATAVTAIGTYVDPAAGCGILESFRHRSFRFQCLSDGFAQGDLEMEALILGWFVPVETDSPFLAGLALPGLVVLQWRTLGTGFPEAWYSRLVLAAWLALVFRPPAHCFLIEF